MSTIFFIHIFLPIGGVLEPCSQLYLLLLLLLVWVLKVIQAHWGTEGALKDVTVFNLIPSHFSHTDSTSSLCSIWVWYFFKLMCEVPWGSCLILVIMCFVSDSLNSTRIQCCTLWRPLTMQWGQCHLSHATCLSNRSHSDGQTVQELYRITPKINTYGRHRDSTHLSLK